MSLGGVQRIAAAALGLLGRSKAVSPIPPTNRVARHSGRLSVATSIKTVTWQRSDTLGMGPVAEETACFPHFGGLQDPARIAADRIHKYFPENAFELG